MQGWNESYLPNTIRSSMDDMEVKVRRRTTGLVLNIECSVVLKSSQYQDFIDWFRVAQQGGAIPTKIKRPNDGKEIVVRASAPPTVKWIQNNVFEASMKFEQMPAWRGL
jgi:hypothetical protein